jgi:hypothetical protein
LDNANIHASRIVLRGACDAFGAPADCGVLLLGREHRGDLENTWRNTRPKYCQFGRAAIPSLGYSAT